MTIPQFMNRSTALRALLASSKVTAIAVGCILGLATCLAPASGAAENATAMRSLDDSRPALPLTANFEKEDGDNGPYGLTLKNTSGNPIKASGVVLLNVGSDATSKTRELPEHVIERAETWSIYGLSTGDRVKIEADGFTSLALTVP
jgi:hypothetical protein